MFLHAVERAGPPTSWQPAKFTAPAAQSSLKVLALSALANFSRD